MARVKRGNVHKNRRRRILKKAKGYYGSDSRLYASARDAVDHAMQYAYVGRKRKKRCSRVSQWKTCSIPSRPSSWARRT